MNYRGIHELNRTIFANLHRVPANTEVVVGIPRSGLLAALLVGLHLDLPVTDVEGLIDGRVFESGQTTKNSSAPIRLTCPKHILLIDDSYHRGASLKKALTQIKDAPLKHHVETMVVFGGRRAADDVGIVLEMVPEPHVFEWNLCRNAILPRTCVDFDGVLCRDPLPEEDDDGSKYEWFLRNAEPLWKPERPLGHIVTSRLEKYRPQTIEWLHRFGIQYKGLQMLAVGSQYEKRRINVAAYKAEAYVRLKGELFIESSTAEAAEIAHLSKRDVLCMQDGKLYTDSGVLAGVMRSSRPKVILERMFQSIGYCFRKFPEQHPIVGPMRKAGRGLYMWLNRR